MFTLRQSTRLDVTALDDPQHPILDEYELLEERWLSPLVPSELPQREFESFFNSSTATWRAFAAGVPWVRDPDTFKAVKQILDKLDSLGAEADTIAYIVSEPGAGGTTLARSLAWQTAREGYPVLIARQVPFVPDPLRIANFLTKVHSEVSRLNHLDSARSVASDQDKRRRYETPWLIVFDTLHSQYREGDLLKFRKEMLKAGRPLCILMVVGSTMPIDFINASGLKQVAELNHAIDEEDAQRLGSHLNRFLSVYGKQKSPQQWAEFYKEHTVQYLDGIAAFWVALSFWLQGQYDLSESIHERVYRAFKEAGLDGPLKEAVLRIAALSSERLPLPEALLPESGTGWPMSQLLSDARQCLAPLGLMRVVADGEKFWAIIHDILARLLLNALFFDNSEKEALGLLESKDPEHLRLKLLRKTAVTPLLGESSLRSIGEDFATTIFKIDPDHGHANFLPYWHEVLECLDSMPAGLRTADRLFIHHTAVSRRRVAKLDPRLSFSPANSQRIELLTRAIDDLKYALNLIEPGRSSESNLNILNSLANAYLDLAEAEAQEIHNPERQAELRRLANEAARQAYAEDPSNSFVVETYIKNLLQIARVEPENAVSSLIEALGVAFAAINSSEREYRKSQLSSLADKALGLLMRSEGSVRIGTLNTPADVLLAAWKQLATGVEGERVSFSDFPQANRQRALEILKHQAGRGNLQIIQLSYHLTCLEFPRDFSRQLALVEQLVASKARVPAQLRLEYAILLYQCDRAREGDREFKSLRHLWHETEQFVQVPERLQWLWTPDQKSARVVSAVVGSGGTFRTTAQVSALASAATPFRPEEMGMRAPSPGTRFTCCVSFGHNGPFLRPVTAKAEASLVSRR